jgi:hypothetical protein
MKAVIVQTRRSLTTLTKTHSVRPLRGRDRSLRLAYHLLLKRPSPLKPPLWLLLDTKTSLHQMVMPAHLHLSRFLHEHLRTTSTCPLRPRRKAAAVLVRACVHLARRRALDNLSLSPRALRRRLGAALGPIRVPVYTGRRQLVADRLLSWSMAPPFLRASAAVDQFMPQPTLPPQSVVVLRLALEAYMARPHH